MRTRRLGCSPTGFFESPIKRIFLVGALLVSAASCVTVQVVTPPASQAIETDSEKVRRSLADLRAVSTTLQSYMVETNKYPRPDTSDICVGEYSFARLDRLSSLPVGFRHNLPVFDPWGFPYLYWTDDRHWILICTGSDGQISDAGRIERRIHAALSSEWNVRPEQTHCLEDEIVVMDGRFLTWPANDTERCSCARPSTPTHEQEKLTPAIPG